MVLMVLGGIPLYMGIHHVRAWCYQPYEVEDGPWSCTCSGDCCGVIFTRAGLGIGIVLAACLLASALGGDINGIGLWVISVVLGMGIAYLVYSLCPECCDCCPETHRQQNAGTAVTSEPETATMHTQAPTRRGAKSTYTPAKSTHTPAPIPPRAHAFAPDPVSAQRQAPQALCSAGCGRTPASGYSTCYHCQTPTETWGVQHGPKCNADHQVSGRGGVRCAVGCGRPAASGYQTCCQTCKESRGARHGPKCSANNPSAVTPTCQRVGCSKPTWNGLQGEFCSRACRNFFPKATDDVGDFRDAD